MPTSPRLSEISDNDIEENIELDEQMLEEAFETCNESFEFDDSIFLNHSVQDEHQLAKNLQEFQKQRFNELDNKNSQKFTQYPEDWRRDLTEATEDHSLSFASAPLQSSQASSSIEMPTLTTSAEIYIPADGDCFYTSIFVGYLLPVLDDQPQFSERLTSLLGWDLIGKEVLWQQMIDALKNQDTNYFRCSEFKNLINDFRAYMGLNNGLWAGKDEIKVLAQRLNIVIQELYVNPDYPNAGDIYTLSDRTQNDDKLELEPDETIFILRTDPARIEACQVSADVDLQTAQAASALSSHNLQHYRLLASRPLGFLEQALVDEEFAAVTSQQLNLQSEPNLQAAKQRTFNLTQEIYNMFHALFSSNSQPSMALLTADFDAHSVFVRVSECLSTASPYPELKTSEYMTLIKLLLRVGILMRPGYFADLPQNRPISMDDMYGVGIKFLQEFVHNGHLAAWVNEIKKNIPTQTTDSEQASLEFIEGIEGFLQYVASDAVHDPTRDPLNKEIPPVNIGRLLELTHWLEDNEGHPKYRRVAQVWEELDSEIRAARNLAMENLANYAFALLKRIKPEIAHKRNMAEAMTEQARASKAEQRKRFEAYVLNTYQQLDISVPNYLRDFWEVISRKQYGQLCYQMVCESFDPQNKDSEVHRIIQTIWAISKLDTIHIKPQEARSRMPNASVDGTNAPNFGYGIESSDAYRKWLANPVVRAYADIIMDAYHVVIDLGSDLDINKFNERFLQYLSDDKNVQLLIIRHPHKYDTFMTSFARVLLEKVFNKAFDKDKGGIKSQLAQAAGTGENLINKAMEALTDFKEFAEAKHTMRPGNDETKPKKTDGLVFGIGFNGNQFDAPEPIKKGRHEIWITFSESARKAKGYHLLMEFIKYISQHSKILTPRIADTGTWLSSSFLKYRAYLQWVIDDKIQGYKQDLATDRMGPQSRPYIEEQLHTYNDFKHQMARTTSFSELSEEFQAWLADTHNWYQVKDNISIKVPEEMPEQERQTQEFARNLLFDSLVQRPFSKVYPQLMPLLFLHWREELLDLLAGQNVKNRVACYRASGQSRRLFDPPTWVSTNSKLITAVKAAKTLADIPALYRDMVIAKLDELVAQVHPELKSSWRKVIRDDEYQAFKGKTAKALEASIKRARENVEGEKQKYEKGKNNPKAVNNLEYKYNKAQDELNKLLQTPSLPAELSQLPAEEFEKFRNYVFEKRDVAQCIEPLFARVLGHDKFFPVYISQKVKQTKVTNEHTQPLQLGNYVPQDVIPPCDARCQIHALGHLYTGDALTAQSADKLDQMRKTHKLGEVPDQWLPLEHPELLSSSYTELGLNEQSGIILGGEPADEELEITEHVSQPSP
jgi:hypothetical protein